MKGRVIWITGASSGIGEALANCLAAKGAKLILSARNKTELDRVGASIKGGEVMCLPLDIADTPSIKPAVEAVLRRYGRLDVLVNNAGLSQRALAMDTTEEVERRLMDINYHGTVNLTKAVLPQMMAQGGGTVAVVSSLVGKFGTPYRSGYAASKHALHGYFDSLRAEIYDKNIQISLICPGFVRTNISLNAATGDGTPQGKMDDATDNGLTPDEFAERMVRALERGKNEAYIGKSELRGVWLKRFFPELLNKMLRKAKVV